MIQKLLVFILISASLAYVVYRIYGSIKIKKACASCELMEAAKKATK